MKNKNFEVYEDNSGDMHLFVFDGERVVYVHSYGVAGHKVGDLLSAIGGLLSGDDPVTDWDGNLIDEEETDGAEWYDDCANGGAALIADTDGIYPDAMGCAGTEEFAPLIRDVD